MTLPRASRWPRSIDQVFIVGTPERAFLAFDTAKHVQESGGPSPIIIWNPRTPFIEWVVKSHPEVPCLQSQASYAQASLGHITALTSGLAMNAQRMMVLEDDISFLSDQQQLEHLLSDLPEDIDVALMDWGALPDRIAQLSESIHRKAEGKNWSRFEEGDIRSTAAYIVSTKGAQRLLESYRMDFIAPPGHQCIPDLRWRELSTQPDLRVYVAPNRLCIKNILHLRPHSGDPRPMYARDKHFIGLDKYSVRVKVMRDTRALRQGLHDLITYTKIPSLSIVEIGSYSGESMEVFLQTGHVREGHCVDVWTDLYDPIDRASAHMDVVEAVFNKRFESTPQVHKHKGTLAQVVHTLPAMPDLVYIDGDHRYTSVMSDIDVAIRELDPSFIAGHDYNLNGVRRAVLDAFHGEPDSVFVDTSWIVSRQRIQDYRTRKRC